MSKPSASVDHSGERTGARTFLAEVVANPGRLSDLTHRYVIVALLGLMIIGFSLVLPNTFATFDNFRVTLITQSVLVILAIGLTFSLAAGEFDFTFGPLAAFSGCLCGYLSSERGWPMIAACGVALVGCFLTGLVNAFFIVRVGLASLIVTLAVGMVIVGITLGFTGSNVMAPPPPGLSSLATGELFGLPYPVYLSFLVAAIAWFIYEHTPLGRYFYFVGEGRSAALLSGLPVNRVRATALVITATVSGIAGMIGFGRLGSADPNLGLTFLLPVTAAVFLGATAIRPGRFNAWGTVIAVYVLVVGVTGLQQLGADSWLENVFYGVALLTAVTFGAVLRRGHGTGLNVSIRP